MNGPKTSKLAGIASALVMAAVLGPGTVQAQSTVADFFSAVLTASCITEWESSPAAAHCNGADDTVTITHVPNDNDRCLVDVDCYISVNLINGPGESDDVPFRYTEYTPYAWRSGTGLARTDLSSIDMCFYHGSLTDAQWIDWADKFAMGCESGEVDSATAVADGLDLRASPAD